VASSRDSAQSSKKFRAIALDHCPRIIFGEAEVQIAFAVRARETSRACGKAMHKPGNGLQLFGAQDVHLGFAECFYRSPSRHVSMLQELEIMSAWFALILGRREF
jgi:hypothetical protein